MTQQKADFQKMMKAVGVFSLIVTEAVAYPILGVYLAYQLRERFDLSILWLAFGALFGLVIAVTRVFLWATRSEKKETQNGGGNDEK